MVAQPGEWRPTFSAGEFGRAFDARVDISQYYAACRRMKNAQPIPQGGFEAMPGTLRRGTVRRQMTFASATRTTYAGPHSSAGSVVELLVFAAPLAVAALVFGDFSISAGSGFVQAQVQVGGNWQNFGPLHDVATTARNRVSAVVPGAAPTATAARLLLYPSESAAWANARLQAATESASLSAAVRMFDYSYSTDETYALVVTPGWCDVWRDGTFRGAFELAAVTAAMVPDLDIYGEGDTVGFFHKDLQTIRAVRAGQDENQWNVDAWPYDKIGSTNYGGSYTKTDDIWTIYIRWINEPDDLVINIIVDGEETGAIILDTAPATATTEWNDFAAAIEAAIEELPSVGDGVTVALDWVGGTREFKITFGGDLSGVEREVGVEAVNSSDISALVSHTQVGKTDGEPFISVARGWPSVATLVQERLAYGGLKAKPTGILFSRTGEIFELNTDAASTAASAFAVAVRETVAEAIQHIIWSKYILVLTDEAEYFANNRVVSAEEPLNFVRASTIGTRRDVIPRDAEGYIYYASKDGNILYMATYDDVQSAYLSTPQSLFASHLFTNVRQSAMIEPDAESDGHRLLFRRSDGRLVQAMVIRSQEINAFSEWVTSGTVESVCVDRQGRVWLAVRRTYAAGPEIVLETMEQGQWLHAAVDHGATDLAGLLTGLEKWEGMTVWIVADGYSMGAYTVVDGEVQLPFAFTQCFVGFWSPVDVETMPLYRVISDGVVLRRPGRIHTAHVTVEDTTSIAIGANGESADDIALYRAGMNTDAPIAPQSTTLTVEGMTGRTVGTTLQVTQVKPGALKVLDLVMEARL